MLVTVLVCMTGVAALAMAADGQVVRLNESASQKELPQFEVASIKPSTAGGNAIEVTAGTVTVHAATVLTCVTWAYSMQRPQVSGATTLLSRELNSDRYDIVAKAARPVPVAQLKLMMQQLLATRFQLTLHSERRDLQMYRLRIDGTGPKFRQSTGDGESVESSSTKLTRRWSRTSMAQFADQLADAMEAPVTDQTGLTSTYDFTLDLTPYLQKTGERPDIGLMMVTALREQLGLKLEAARAPVDVLVIDHIERPSEN
jgi:uncharacterized protein (TIGR03435 family)